MLRPRFQNTGKHPIGTTLLLLTWWFTSVTGTLINKKVMKQFPYPIAFTALHLGIGALLDYIIISTRNINKLPLAAASSSLELNKLSGISSFRETSLNNLKFHYEHFRICMLNGIFFSMAKYLTYLSYRQVPVSLTHTIKSMSPVFSVISQILILKHCVPLSEILTLVPIIIGVTLSTISELEFEIIGFLAALTSSVLGVLQNTTSKYILSHSTTPKAKAQTRQKHIITPMQLHFYGSLLSLTCLIPFSIYSEGNNIYLMKHDSGHIPYYYMLMSCIWLYAQTMASLFLLKRVTTVTHNVANTCKRFWIIIVSIIYFNRYNSITYSNFCGIFLALTGFFLYQKIHRKNNKKKLKNKLLKDLYKNKININIKHKNGKYNNGKITLNHQQNTHHRHANETFEDIDDHVELGDTENLPLLNNSNPSHDQ